MESNNGLSGPRIALLIDFDNVVLGIDDPGFDVELVVNALRERGNIVLGRAYGDWYRHNRHRRKLMEQGLELVETPAFGPVIKNSADIRIALDGFEVAMTQDHIDTFCIVSGDSDFLPLIKKLQVLGKNVLVICGTRFTSDMLRRNCNEFIAYENLLAASVGATEDATTLDGAFALLHRAMAALRERGTQIRTSTLKQMMLQLNPVFSEKNFGCSQFRQFLDKAVANKLVKLGPRDRVSGELYVLLPDDDPDEVLDNAEIRPEPRGFNRREERREERTDSQRETQREFAEEKADELPTRRSRIRGARRRERSGEAVETNESSLIVPLPAIEESVAATPQETSDLALSRSDLLSRGLRPGRRRFSGKTGGLERVEDETTKATAQNATETSEEPAATTEPIALSEAETPEAVPEVSADASNEVAAEASAEAEKPKTRTRRRSTRRKTSEEAPAETSVETAPVAEKAVEAQAESPTTEAPSVSEQIRSETAAETAVETAPEAKPEVATEAEAEPKKPARRTRTRKTVAKKAAEEAPANAEAATEKVEENSASEANSEAEASASAEAEPKKPTRRRRTTTRKKKTEESGASEE